jgi:hypothetical protein
MKYAVIFIIFITTQIGEARIVKIWDYEKLTKAADIVVIVEPISNTNVDDIYAEHLYGFKTSDFIAINTAFKVLQVFKGTYDKNESLTLLHYNYSSSVGMAFNGARFVHFLIGSQEIEKKLIRGEKEVVNITRYSYGPVWMAFLKKREDGRYEPVSVQYDSAESFKEIYNASPHFP